MTTPGHSPDCFVCGFLGVEVLVGEAAGGPGSAVSDLLLDGRFTGPPGFAHGGITAALFDELLGAAVCDRTPVSYTAHLEIDYRRPWRIGEPARMAASTEWLSERKLQARSTLVASDGGVIAEAHGLWIVPRPAAGARTA